MNLFVRLCGFAARFAVGVSSFGLAGALKVFLVLRSRELKEPTSVRIRKLNRRVYFRGASDGVIVSHFCTPCYRIVDDETPTKVRHIIDAGANIGDETLRFRHFHPEARIIAIEAEPSNYRLLVLNTKGDAGTACLNRGLWARNCRLRVIPGTSNESFSVAEVPDLEQDYDIDGVSIGHVMREFDIDEIDILKLDIEGAERKMFGADSVMEWISKVKVIIMECPDNDIPGTTMLAFEKLRRAGTTFRCHLSGENLVLIRDDVPWTLTEALGF